MQRRNDSIRRLVAGLAFFGAFLDTIFWALYLTEGIQFGETANLIVEGFESAFLFADALLAITLIVAGIGLLRNRAYGSFFTAIASSMALYLGLLDFTFYSKQGLYSLNSISGLIETIINATCIVGGLTGLVMAGRFWRFGHGTAQASR
jgi:hypothetical protein